MINRLKLFAGSKFQIKYMIMVLLIVAVSSSVIGGGVYFIIKSEVQSQLTDIAEQTLKSAVIFSEVNSFLLVLIPVLFILIALVSLLLLHKIAGPEYRLEQHLQSMARGDFTFSSEVIKGEELAALVKTLKYTKECLSAMILEERELVNKLLLTANDILRELDKKELKKEIISKQINELASVLEQLQILMTRYHISKPVK